MVTVTIYFFSSGFFGSGVNSSGPLSSTGGGSGFFCAAGAGLGAALGTGGGLAAGFFSSCGGSALAGVAGSSPRRFLLSRQARAHSGQRKPPVLRPPLVCGTRCLAQIDCSQFAHLLTAGWPQGFFFSNPVSTVQVSVMRMSVRNCPVHQRAAAYSAARPRWYRRSRRSPVRRSL